MGFLPSVAFLLDFCFGVVVFVCYHDNNDDARMTYKILLSAARPKSTTYKTPTWYSLAKSNCSRPYFAWKHKQRNLHPSIFFFTKVRIESRFVKLQPSSSTKTLPFCQTDQTAVKCHASGSTEENNIQLVVSTLTDFPQRENNHTQGRVTSSAAPCRERGSCLLQNRLRWRVRCGPAFAESTSEFFADNGQLVRLARNSFELTNSEDVQ